MKTVWGNETQTQAQRVAKWEADHSIQADDLMDLAIILYMEAFECKASHASRMIFSDLSDTFEFQDVKNVYWYVENLKKL